MRKPKLSGGVKKTVDINVLINKFLQTYRFLIEKIATMSLIKTARLTV